MKIRVGETQSKYLLIIARKFALTRGAMSISIFLHGQLYLPTLILEERQTSIPIRKNTPPLILSYMNLYLSRLLRLPHWLQGQH